MRKALATESTEYTWQNSLNMFCIYFKAMHFQHSIEKHIE